MPPINSDLVDAGSSKNEDKLEYCDTDIFFLIKISYPTNVDFEKLKNFFNSILKEASQIDFKDLTKFFNKILKKEIHEKTFDFSRVTLRYYNNNYMVFHTRVFGPPRTCERRLKDQLSASNIASIGIKNIMEKFEIKGEIFKQIWVFYSINTMELKEDVNQKESSCKFREICLLNRNDYCFGLYLDNNVILGTSLQRNVAEGALTGVSYSIIQDIMDGNNDPEFILSQINKYFQKGTIFRASAERPFTLTFWISFFIFAIFTIYLFLNALFTEGDLLFKSGIAFIGLSLTIGLYSLWTRYGRFNIIR